VPLFVIMFTAAFSMNGKPLTYTPLETIYVHSCTLGGLAGRTLGSTPTTEARSIINPLLCLDAQVNCSHLVRRVSPFVCFAPT
jgi:hypothetical protein